MSDNQAVADHYHHGSLLQAITDALLTQGKSPADLRVADLAAVGEFHVGGQQATEHLLEQLALSAEHRLLDIGCGLGGSARAIASYYGSSVTGLDLTPEYVETGSTLNRWLGLQDKIELICADALNTPFQAASFDRATLLHVGMNIDDKQGLFSELARVLKPGALFGIYDILKTSSGDLVYPLPWASHGSISFLGSIESYTVALQASGFEVLSSNNRRRFAQDFFAQMAARAVAKKPGPALGLHTLMQEQSPEKVQNLVAAIADKRVAPVEILARRR